MLHDASTLQVATRTEPERIETPGIPRVSVVIPSNGRPSLDDAVASVLAQTHGVHEVLICANGEIGPDERDRLDRLDGGRVRVLETDACNVAAARQCGTLAAAGEWVAYLDDDDTWLPERLTTQLRAASRSVWLVSSRIEQRTTSGEKLGEAPAQVYADDADVAEWLFRNRRLNRARNILHTSTLLVRSEVAKQTTWDASLDSQEDWDFIVRGACHAPGMRIHQVDDALAVITVASDNSLSASATAADALAFGERLATDHSRRAASDYVCGQALRLALQNRQWSDAGTALRLLVTLPPPTPRAIVLGASGLLSRDAFQRLLVGRRRSNGTGS